MTRAAPTATPAMNMATTTLAVWVISRGAVHAPSLRCPIGSRPHCPAKRKICRFATRIAETRGSEVALLQEATLWIILVVIAALGAGTMGYRAATGYEDAARDQQSLAAPEQVFHKDSVGQHG